MVSPACFSGRVLIPDYQTLHAASAAKLGRSPEGKERTRPGEAKPHRTSKRQSRTGTKRDILRFCRTRTNRNIGIHTCGAPFRPFAFLPFRPRVGRAALTCFSAFYSIRSQ